MTETFELSEFEARILEAVRDEADEFGAITGWVATAVRHTERFTGMTLGRLYTSGLVDRQDRDRLFSYQLTDAGRKALTTAREGTA